MQKQKKLYLSEYDKKIAGVCGGIAEYFEIDSTVIRLLWILLTICAGGGLIAYLIAWAIIPKRPLIENSQNYQYENNSGKNDYKEKDYDINDYEKNNYNKNNTNNNDLTNK